MGSSSAPAYTEGNILRDMREGSEFALNQMTQGLDPRQRAMLEGRSAGAQRSGEQGLREQFASMGNTPVGAQVGAQTQLRSNLNKNLQDSLLQGDLQAKQSGMQNYLALQGLEQGIINPKNQYNMQKYELDSQPGFWEGLLQSIMSGGSNIFGGYLAGRK